MVQLFIPDFMTNRMIQYIIIGCTLFELLIAKSIKHSMTLISIPYLTSLFLHYQFKPQKIKRRRISEQYRPRLKD